MAPQFEYYSALLNNQSEYRNLQLYVKVELWGQWQETNNVYASTNCEALYY